VIVSFLDGRMMLIDLDYEHRKNQPAPKALPLDWWRPVSRADRGQFMGFLRAHAIWCQRVAEEWLKPGIRLWLPEGRITVVFYDETGFRPAQILSAALGPTRVSLEDCF
jgi:hypothetical protein